MINNGNLLNQYDESKRIIRQAMEDKQLVLFVGAGASIASGMPTWGQAVNEIAKRLSLKGDNLDYLRIPQYYFNTRGKKEYTQLMRKIFRHSEYLMPHAIHKKIIDFNTETIITTNYDHLIEQAAEENSQIISVVSKDTDLPYRKGGRELIKMHGDFENDNFVLKEDDYLAYDRNFKLIENYVRSLIGTKVVLFVGYSFSDPDLKLIFSWVKDILGGDFQRAYLIESGKAYDINESDYFRNFGINILYASVQFENDFNKDNLTNNLLLMLDWLLTPYSTDKLTSLYNDLKPFGSMNYASYNYLDIALYKVGIRSDNNKLVIDDTIKKSEKDTKDLFNALAYLQWTKLGENITISDDLILYTYFDKNKSIEEWQEENNKRAEEYFKDYKSNKNDYHKISFILDVLYKSSIKMIECHLPGARRSGWRVLCIPIASPNTYDWMDKVNTFDYSALEAIVKTNSEHLSITNPELYMEQGYIQYILGNYLAAYNCYKNAKTIYYNRQEYIRFFIAEFDRWILAKTIIRNDGIICGVSKSDVDSVKKECNSICLDKLFDSLPDLGDSNKVLKDMYTFNVAYSLFRDAYNNSEIVHEQANTKYLFFSGKAAFAGMRNDITDYYNYITMNMLPVNNYAEHNNIFRIYFSSIVNSVMVTDKNVSTFGTEVLHRVHPNELQSFDILVALKFENLKDLDRIIKDYNTNIPLSSDALNYLNTVVYNCKSRIPKSVFMFDTTFWKCITILGHSNLTVELVDLILQKINEPIGTDDLRLQVNRVIVFLNNANKQKMISKKGVDCIRNHLIKTLGAINADKGTTIALKNLIITELRILKDEGNTFDRIDSIKSIISDETRLMCLSIYSYLGDNCKAAIAKKYNDWSFDASSSGFEFYYYLVDTGIIRPNQEVEKQIFEYYSKNDDNSKGDGGEISFPMQNEDDFLYQLLELFLKDLVIDKTTCKKIIKQHNIPGAEWLMNYKEYDYENFDVNWLLACTPKLLDDFCRDGKIKQNIKHAVEKAYRIGNIDSKITDIYFKTLV